MPAEVVGALIAIGGVLLGSVVTAVVSLQVEQSRQKAESTRQAQALAAERERLESAFAHDCSTRQLEWRRAERKVVIDRARGFLNEASFVLEQISVRRASQAVSGQPTAEQDSYWVQRMTDVLNRHGGVWLSVPDPQLGQLLRDLAVAPLFPDWLPSLEYEERVRQAYRRLEEVAALLDEPHQPSSGS
jgi:hypothetical protein